jgi:hypothetical protein
MDEQKRYARVYARSVDSGTGNLQSMCDRGKHFTIDYPTNPNLPEDKKKPSIWGNRITRCDGSCEKFGEIPSHLIAQIDLTAV